MDNDTPFVTRCYNIGLKTVPNLVKFFLRNPKLLEYYEKHLDQLPAALDRGLILPRQTPRTLVPMAPFVFMDSFDIFVPASYDPATQLAKFKKECKKAFFDYDDRVSDSNFSQPTHQLRGGQHLKVALWEQRVALTTIDEQLAFLKSQDAMLVGAQGLSLLFAQKWDRLARGYDYISLDERRALLRHARGYLAPRISLDPDETDLIYSLGLVNVIEGLANDSSSHNCLLSFRDVE